MSSPSFCPSLLSPVAAGRHGLVGDPLVRSNVGRRKAAYLGLRAEKDQLKKARHSRPSTFIFVAECKVIRRQSKQLCCPGCGCELKRNSQHKTRVPYLCHPGGTSRGFVQLSPYVQWI